MGNTLIFLLFLTAVLGCKDEVSEEPSISSEVEIESLQASVDSLKRENDSLSALFISNKGDSNFWYNPLYDGSNLLRQGIENPGEFIEKSLREKPELIPLKGVLGGTMRYGKIQPLGSEWVIAYYDDGHIEGRAIYKYQINAQGKLEFQLLDDVKPEE